MQRALIKQSNKAAFESNFVVSSFAVSYTHLSITGTIAATAAAAAAAVVH